MSYVRRAIVLISIGLLAGGCQREVSSSIPLPATYRGELPCADCPGTIWTLELNADSSYVLRIEYLESGEDGSSAYFDQFGHFILAHDNKVVELYNGEEIADRFAIDGDSTLRRLDIDGERIKSNLNYALTRIPGLKE